MIQNYLNLIIFSYISILTLILEQDLYQTNNHISHEYSINPRILEYLPARNNERFCSHCARQLAVLYVTGAIKSESVGYLEEKSSCFVTFEYYMGFFNGKLIT